MDDTTDFVPTLVINSNSPNISPNATNDVQHRSTHIRSDADWSSEMTERNARLHERADNVDDDEQLAELEKKRQPPIDETAVLGATSCRAVTLTAASPNAELGTRGRRMATFLSTADVRLFFGAGVTGQTQPMLDAGQSFLLTAGSAVLRRIPISGAVFAQRIAADATVSVLEETALTGTRGAVYGTL